MFEIVKMIAIAYCLAVGIGSDTPANAQMVCDALPDEVCAACRIVPDVKKTPKAVFACKTIYYCEHRFPGFQNGGCCFSKEDCCESQCCPDCIRCGKVRSKRVLLKKFVTEEKPILKCEVATPEAEEPGVPSHSKLHALSTRHPAAQVPIASGEETPVREVSSLVPKHGLEFRNRR